MPNTGQLHGQAFKCQNCRKNFKAVWMPSNVCCRIEAMEAEKKAVMQRPVNMYSRYMTEDTKSSSGSSKKSALSTPNSSPSSLGFGNLQTTARASSKSVANPRMKYVNSLAPFSTLGKSTCGYYFSRETDNKKMKTGIPPSNLVAWRSYIS